MRNQRSAYVSSTCFRDGIIDSFYFCVQASLFSDVFHHRNRTHYDGVDILLVVVDFCTDLFGSYIGERVVKMSKLWIT